jgi:hypothetical protein
MLLTVMMSPLHQSDTSASTALIGTVALSEWARNGYPEKCDAGRPFRAVNLAGALTAAGATTRTNSNLGTGDLLRLQSQPRKSCQK